MFSDGKTLSLFNVNCIHNLSAGLHLIPTCLKSEFTRKQHRHCLALWSASTSSLRGSLKYSYIFSKHKDWISERNGVRSIPSLQCKCRICREPYIHDSIASIAFLLQLVTTILVNGIWREVPFIWRSTDIQPPTSPSLRLQLH